MKHETKQKIVEHITKTLEDKIESCNRDPKFMNPFFTKGGNPINKDYVPLRKIPHAWGQETPMYLTEGMRIFYRWRFYYEASRGPSSDSINLWYMPPIEDQHWVEDLKSANPDIDLSRPCFYLVGGETPDESLENFSSNSYEEVIQDIFRRIESVAESRKDGFYIR